MSHERTELAYSALTASNYALALPAFSALAAEGSPHAWKSLGWMHQHAAGTAKDFAKAEACYRKAIGLGDSTANFYLARLLVEDQRLEEAFAYFLAEADQGHLSSIYWTGRCYLSGEGVEKDVEKAELYLKRAADKGHLYARRDCSLEKMHGTFGKRDLLNGVVGWISTFLSLIRLSASDPGSELLH